MRTFTTEKRLSAALFFCRALCAISFAYLFLGIFFHLRSFAENIASLGVGVYPVYFSLAFCIMGLMLACTLMLGYKTRLSAWVLFISCVFGVFVFAGNNLDRIYINFLLFSMAGLCPVLFLGPGSISIDYRRAMEKEKKFLSR